MVLIDSLFSILMAVIASYYASAAATSVSMAFVVLLIEFVGWTGLIPDSFYLKVQVGDVMSRKEKNLLHLSF